MNLFKKTPTVKPVARPEPEEQSKPEMTPEEFRAFLEDDDSVTAVISEFEEVTQ